MKKLTFSLILMLAMVSISYASKWRVNNLTGIDADFTSLQQAHDDAGVVAGDTIYLEGTGVSYGNFSASKKLVIVGPGYFLAENDSTQAAFAAAIVGNIAFNAGSDGSTITGVTITGSFSISANYILVKRNYYTYVSVPIYVYASFAQFSQNYIYGGFQFLNGANNYIINNNFIFGAQVQYCGSCFDYNAILCDGGTSGQVYNNVFQSGSFTLYNCSFRNNIRNSNVFYTGSYFNAYSSSVVNNIDVGTMFGNINGNQQNVDPESVYVCYSNCTGYSTDERYHLKIGSPAIGTGVGGVDCGMFGGPTPYVLSGMPTFPAIWQLDVIGTQVTVKAKSH